MSDHDAIIARLRVQAAGVPVPPSGELSDRAAEEIADATRTYLNDRGLKVRDLAGLLSLDGELVERVLCGAADVTAAERSRVLIACNYLLQSDAAARSHGAAGAFVRTKVACRLQQAVDHLRQRHDMAIATGPAGCGKSRTLQAIAAEYPGTLHVRVDDETKASRRLTLALFAAAAGKARIRGGSGITLGDVIERLQSPASVRAKRVVMIDEAHRLQDRALELLRDVHDQAGCSILLVGTVDLMRRISDDLDPQFGQMASRVGLRLDLTAELFGVGPDDRGAKLYTIDEIRAVFRAGQLRLRDDAIQMLAGIANEVGRGHLRRVVRLAEWAAKVAKHFGRDEITAQDIRSAIEIVEQSTTARAAATPTKRQRKAVGA